MGTPLGAEIDAAQRGSRHALALAQTSLLVEDPMLRKLRSFATALLLVGSAGLSCRPEAQESPTLRAPPPRVETGAPDTAAPQAPDPTTPADSGDPPTRPDTGPPAQTSPLTGYIGSPCAEDADCPYPGGRCLTEDLGYPAGSCSAPCADWCEDQTGHPTTSCIDALSLPASFDEAAGACLSRCDFGLYPYTGCRADYGCTQVARADASLLDVFACLPWADLALDDCRTDLAQAGVAFEPQILADDSPEGQPDLTCHVRDPVRVGPRVGGVDLRYLGSDPARVLVDCETASALVASGRDVADQGVTEILHLGTYNCRTIAGTDTLSQHGLGRALDVYGFTFADGTAVTVVDHWEHGDATPSQWAGQFLYETIHRWYDAWIWNILLTPEYNAAHDNHFHVDLTEGAHSLSLAPDRPHHLGPFPPGQVD